jgi:integral membrane protein
MRLTERGLKGALFRYQVMANIVGVLVIPLFIFFFLKLGFGGFQIELAILGVGHGYLYIVYLITAGALALKARLHVKDGRISPSGVGWIILMFVAGLVPGLTFVVEWLVVTRKIQPLLAPRAAGAEPGVSPAAR